jgi:hypothetical protein
MLKDFARRVHEAFDHEVIGAVLSISARFKSEQRDELIHAMKRGYPELQVISVADELEAAATAYASQMESAWLATAKTVLIVDFGAGKVDVGVYVIRSDECRMIHRGNKEIGGRDIDDLLVDRYIKKHSINLTSLDFEVRTRLYSCLVDRCRQAKEILSTENYAEIDLNVNRTPLQAGLCRLDRKTFESVCKTVFGEVKGLVRATVNAAKLKKPDDILLLGGSCKSPIVRKRIFGLWSISDNNREYDMLVAHGVIEAAARHHFESAPASKPQAESHPISSLCQVAPSGTDPPSAQLQDQQHISAERNERHDSAESLVLPKPRIDNHLIWCVPSAGSQYAVLTYLASQNLIAISTQGVDSRAANGFFQMFGGHTDPVCVFGLGIIQFDFRCTMAFIVSAYVGIRAVLPEEAAMAIEWDVQFWNGKEWIMAIGACPLKQGTFFGKDFGFNRESTPVTAICLRLWASAPVGQEVSVVLDRFELEGAVLMP